MIVFSTSTLTDLFAAVLVFREDGSLRQAIPQDHPLAQAVAAGAAIPGSAAESCAADVAVAVTLATLHGKGRHVSVAINHDLGLSLANPQSSENDQTYDLDVMPMASGGAVVIARDNTLQTNLRTALIESRQRYRDFVEISADFAWETGTDGCFVFVSPRGALGYSAADLVGRNPATLLLTPAVDGLGLFYRDTAIDDQEIWMRRVDGTPACVQMSIKPVTDRDGRLLGTRGVCRDVTEERSREAELTRVRNRERILNHIIRSFRDEVDFSSILAVAGETVSRGLGADWCCLFRRADDTSTGPGPLILAACNGQRTTLTGEDALLQRLQAGEPVIAAEIDGYFVVAAAAHYRGRINGAVILGRTAARGPWLADDPLLVEDIADQIAIVNEQITIHDDVTRLSRTDSLTALLNRRAFYEELERRYARLSQGAGMAALMYVDLDNFKLVNDQHGHAAGDSVLRLVSSLLSANTRPTDLVARLGGDEFAVWLEGGTHRIAETRAEAFLELATRHLVPLSGLPDRPLNLSIGISVYDPASRESLDALMARADRAMYEIKRDTKGGWLIAPAAALVGGPA